MQSTYILEHGYIQMNERYNKKTISRIKESKLGDPYALHGMITSSFKLVCRVRSCFKLCLAKLQSRAIALG